MTNVDEAYEEWMDAFWPKFASMPMDEREPFKRAFEAGAYALFKQAFLVEPKEGGSPYSTAVRFLTYSCEQKL